MAAAVIAALACATVSAPVASAAPNAPRISAKQPAPGERLQTYFPNISASIDPTPRADSLHIFLDGHDVSSSASVGAGKLQYVPSERMEPGWHDVFVEGTGPDNQPFSDSWAFQTVAPDYAQRVEGSNFQFFQSGGTTFYPGRFMHFFFIAPDNGFAVLQLCGLGEFPFTRVPSSPAFFVTVPVPELAYNPFANCEVQAIFTPIGGFSPFFVPLPGIIGIFSPHRHAVMAGQFPRTTLPVFRRPENGFAPRVTMPVYRTAPMPVYRTVPMPVARPIAVPRPVVPVRRCCAD